MKRERDTVWLVSGAVRTHTMLEFAVSWAIRGVPQTKVTDHR